MHLWSPQTWQEPMGAGCLRLALGLAQRHLVKRGGTARGPQAWTALFYLYDGQNGTVLVKMNDSVFSDSKRKAEIAQMLAPSFGSNLCTYDF